MCDLCQNTVRSKSMAEKQNLEYACANGSLSLAGVTWESFSREYSSFVLHRSSDRAQGSKRKTSEDKRRDHTFETELRQTKCGTDNAPKGETHNVSEMRKAEQGFDRMRR